MYSYILLVIEAFRQKYRLVGMVGQILEKKEKKKCFFGDDPKSKILR